MPSLRLAGAGAVEAPFSVDLHIEKVFARARFVLVRLLGGLDYWRYGVENWPSPRGAMGFALALIPGDVAQTRGWSGPRPCRPRI